MTESRPRTVTILVSESDSFKVSIADYLSRTLSTDVLTVSVRSLPWSDYLTALQNGNFDLYLGEVRLTANWDISSLARTGGTLNYGRYADEQCNTLLDAFSLNETDQRAVPLPCPERAHRAHRIQDRVGPDAERPHRRTEPHRLLPVLRDRGLDGAL